MCNGARVHSVAGLTSTRTRPTRVPGPAGSPPLAQRDTADGRVVPR